MQSEETNLEFPCHYDLKIMGKNDTAFIGVVMEIVNRHIPKLGEGAIKQKESKKGNYTSMTVSFTAQSKEQLDAIYIDLSASELVLMAL